MKKLIIVFIISILLLCGCNKYIPIEEHNKLQEEYNQLKEDSHTTEVKLYSELSQKEEKLRLSQEEVKGYENLIDNLNELLSCIYYGWASNQNWESEGFTAFSIEYKGKFYLITAGHCVHYKDDKIDTGVYTYFKFKANFSDEWVYPELLTYNNVDDYAVLYSNKINNGLKISKDTIYDIYNLDLDLYVLGNEDTGVNIFKKSGIRIEGESGSPIISQNGEVVGIVVDSLLGTPIDIVIEAIDNL